MATSEERLIERLRRIEALHASTDFAGERAAAENARESILNKLKALRNASEPLVEYRFSMPDPWKRRVFCALLRRYGIRPYRYYRQRHSTVMAKLSDQFVDETLWPEYLAISDELSKYLDEITTRVIRASFDQDGSDPDELRGQLGSAD